VGDASSHSETEGDNAKSQRLLGNYFASLKQSGTTRNVVEEKDTAFKKTIISKWNILWKHYFHKQSLTLFYFQNSASRRGTSTPLGSVIAEA